MPAFGGGTQGSRGDGPQARSTLRREVTVDADRMGLPGELAVPSDPIGTVLFAHGSGSSRLSPRNVRVADGLNAARVGTLLFDLLTPVEAADRANVFDIDLLAERLCGASAWLDGWPEVGHLPFGFFGASTGAAAALVAAAALGRDVAAVVSRGGRPDLAGEALERVVAPTLLIVGGHDRMVLELNRDAASRLHVEHRVEVVPGAGHLFEEPGALQEVTRLATEWFVPHLTVAGRSGSAARG